MTICWKAEPDNTFAMTAEQAEKYAFAVGDVLCMGDGESYDTDSIFVKISDLLEQDETVYVTASDAEIEDVFKDVDVSFAQDLPADTLIGEIDTQAIEDAIRNGEGFAQMTDMLAALLTESKTVQGELQAAGSPAFTENASIKEETMKSISAVWQRGRLLPSLSVRRIIRISERTRMTLSLSASR